MTFVRFYGRLLLVLVRLKASWGRRMQNQIARRMSNEQTRDSGVKMSTYTIEFVNPKGERWEAVMGRVVDPPSRNSCPGVYVQAFKLDDSGERTGETTPVPLEGVRALTGCV